MWRLAAGLDWDTIAQLSQSWANRYELTLARDFVDHLDTLPEGETRAAAVRGRGDGRGERGDGGRVEKAIRRKMVLGLVAEVARFRRGPQGPAVACRVRLTASEAPVQVSSSDATARNWVAVRQVHSSGGRRTGEVRRGRFADGLAEGVLNRLVRAQVIKGRRGQGEAALPAPDRQCLAADPQRPGGVGDGQQAGRGAQGAGGHLRLAAAKHDDPGERGSRQGVGPQEGDQADGARPERAVSRAREKTPDNDRRSVHHRSKPTASVLPAARGGHLRANRTRGYVIARR